MRVQLTPRAHYVTALLGASGVSIGLALMSTLVMHQLMYPYLVWNLFLAWLPLLLAYWLTRVLGRKLWSSWEAIIITCVWVAMLPNSFYVVSDFVHIYELDPDQVLLGAVTITAFSFTSLCLGITSLYLVHTQLLRRLSQASAAGVVGSLLLLSSVAIYVGRDLRWNSWDVVFNPFGLLFDLSDRAIHPGQYPQVLGVILPFFTLLAAMYYVAWRGAEVVKRVQS